MQMLICFQGYGSDGLKLLSHEESISFGESVLKLTFDPGTVEDGLLTVECKLDHPFYVKNKGKASIVFVQTDPLRLELTDGWELPVVPQLSGRAVSTCNFWAIFSPDFIKT